MSPRRVLLVALLVAVAGCTGDGPSGGVGDDTTTTTAAATTAPTTGETIEPHTAHGTSHTSRHLTVQAWHDAENVTVTLAPEGDTEQFAVRAGEERSFTRSIHERGHGVHVVVERDGEVVYEASVLAYQYHRVTVRENETSVTKAVT
ncbi:hypothetical protein [Halobacterium jilantaiense]|uniref:Uncharacterized protein n=1 Tax=Halobacterium jilantaiense TaxID=355548 RepID=A0A1I0NKU5_9EURY|nr:hypothetical protein [Halobacterium jilantaiense]SEW01926.1 hypothetical protein SAMN04487945_0953 [Halobacterium jilantaiense]